MKYAGGVALALFLCGCGGFFKEIPLGDGEEQGTQGSNPNSTASTGEHSSTTPRLDCSQALSDCPEQDQLRSCEGQPRVPKVQSCAQSCGSMTAITCTANRDLSSHGCWCEKTGKVNHSGCTGLSSCVARCGGPEGRESCVASCFARVDATAARLYGALFFCAQKDCESICVHQPAQCARCVQETMNGQLGACVALSASCKQDLGELNPG